MFKKANQVFSEEQIDHKPLLLWPGVVALILQWLVKFGIPLVVPAAIGIGIFGGLFFGLVIIVWWAFFSRAPRKERWGAIVLMAIAMFVTSLLLDESIATAQMGLTYFIYSIPFLCLAFVTWAVVSRRFNTQIRRITMAVTIIIACGAWTLLRTKGMTSDIGHEFAWRWEKTTEDRLLAQEGSEASALTSDLTLVENGPLWPGFRGSQRDGIVHNMRIETDWSVSPPVELWRRPVGPGWSSFAVHGELLFTQEQRGDEEVVSCYNVSSGKPVWKHSDSARFSGAAAHPGPRATPALKDQRIYSLGATGFLNALNMQDGSVVWSRNTVADAKEKVPVWGFASSPLVVHNMVIVHVAKTLSAYDLSTGDPIWFGMVGTGYSSPHLFTIDGIEQVLLQSSTGVTSFNPADGVVLWEYQWPDEDRILQPAIIAERDILLSSILNELRRITITHDTDGWSIEEKWTSARMKSNFNDFVIHKGHAYGFDGTKLVCIDLGDGNRKWKGGRYGGQLILLADQDLLLVLSEKGELSLIDANPEKMTELESLQVIKGKTWNHPVLVGNILLVRNSVEMAAYQLTSGDG
ncbi:MAG: alcohol dehydrogenase [Bacteroidetes bacterium]|nr:MAG: alcohol dehydrogenase [Bacteroidota bacterium]